MKLHLALKTSLRVRGKTAGQRVLGMSREGANLQPAPLTRFQGTSGRPVGTRLTREMLCTLGAQIYQAFLIPAATASGLGASEAAAGALHYRLLSAPESA